MQRFDGDGKLIIPRAGKKVQPSEAPPAIVTQVFCPDGHSLINPRMQFNAHSGIVIKARQNSNTGLIGLSPIVGDKSRFSLDLDLQDNAILWLGCPHCDAPLPDHSPCECGATLVVLSLTTPPSYDKCIGICNRVGCPHAVFIQNDELLALASQSI